MKIIIVGCGRVGQTLAEQLNEEGNNITVVDSPLSGWFFCAAHTSCSLNRYSFTAFFLSFAFGNIV